MPARRLRFTWPVLAAVLALPASASAVTVYEAASLKEAFPAITKAPTYSAAGSDQLALQIQHGAPADVFAAANLKYPLQLQRHGLCGQPVVFATNVLVLIVPRANPAGIHSVYDLGRGARKRLAVGSAAVPIGTYTRTLLARLGLSRVLTRNIVSSASNVSAVVAQVALGSADAGFVYATDYLSARDRLGRLRLPLYAQPPVRYGICAVRRAGADRAGAAQFIRAVLGPTGRAVLRRFGFGLPRLR